MNSLISKMFYLNDAEIFKSYYNTMIALYLTCSNWEKDTE